MNLYDVITDLLCEIADEVLDDDGNSSVEEWSDGWIDGWIDATARRVVAAIADHLLNGTGIVMIDAGAEQ